MLRASILVSRATIEDDPSSTEFGATADPSESNSNDVPGGAIAGIVVAAVLLALIVLYCCVKKFRTSLPPVEEPKEEEEGPAEEVEKDDEEPTPVAVILTDDTASLSGDEGDALNDGDFVGADPAHLGRTHSTLDVHRCKSAVCKQCQKDCDDSCEERHNNVTFVASYPSFARAVDASDASDESLADEGVEVGISGVTEEHQHRHYRVEQDLELTDASSDDDYESGDESTKSGGPSDDGIAGHRHPTNIVNLAFQPVRSRGGGGGGASSYVLFEKSPRDKEEEEDSDAPFHDEDGKSSGSSSRRLEDGATSFTRSRSTASNTGHSFMSHEDASRAHSEIMRGLDISRAV